MSFVLVFRISMCEIFRKLDLTNEIKITINGKGTQSVLYSQYSYRPDTILIDGNSYTINSQNKISNLQNEKNIITMKWNNKLTDCSKMFLNLSNIIEIDLSNFDSSNVNNMESLFNGCKY